MASVQFGTTILIVTFIAVVLILFFRLLHSRYTAYQLLKKARANPDFLNELNNSEELHRLAHRLASVGQLKKALMAWRRYLDLVQDSAEARMERGKIFYQSRKYERALAELKKARDAEEDGFPEIELYLGRCYREKGNIQRALDAYKNYLDNVPENLNIAFEIAEAAREGQKFDEAREIYNLIRSRGVRQLFITATLQLVQLELEQGNTEEVADYLKELYRLEKQNKLTPGDDLEIRYHHARLLERKGRIEEALRLYQHIYKIQPDYRDVNRSIEEYIDSLEDREFLADYLESDRQSFVEISRRIVELMGYEPESVFQPEEGGVGIVATGAGGFWGGEKIIYNFKKWDHAVSEWPVREFELNVIEKSAQKGYFVSPGGFNPGAIKFSRGKDDIELIGPEELVNYLPEIKKEQID